MILRHFPNCSKRNSPCKIGYYLQSIQCIFILVLLYGEECFLLFPKCKEGNLFRYWLSLSVSCIGKYTFNHYIFHCSLVAIAKGNYFSSLSVLPTSDTVLHNQTKCKLVTLILLHFTSSKNPSVWKF